MALSPGSLTTGRGLVRSDLADGLTQAEPVGGLSQAEPVGSVAQLVPAAVLAGPWVIVASVLAAIGSVALAARIWRYRGRPGADWLLASLGWQAVWSAVYAVALVTFAGPLRWALEVLVWTAMGGQVTTFVAFALAYTGRADLDGRRRHLVMAAPVVPLVLGATNPIHRLAWTGFELAPVGGLATVQYALQPWALAGATGGVVLALLGSLVLFDTVVSYGPLYRREAVAVGLSTIPPSAGLLAWLYGVGPVPALNLTTVLFLPHLALDAVAFLGRDMFDFHPVTRRTGERAAIEDLGAPVVICDTDGRVVTLNAAAEDVFDTTTRDARTRPLSTFLGADGEAGDAAEGATAHAEDGATADEANGATADAADGADGAADSTDGADVDPLTADRLTLSVDGQRRTFAVSARRLTDPRGRHVGHALALQDVSDAIRREQRLAVLNRVLRHNLRNDLTVVRGRVSAVADDLEDPAAGHLETALETVDGLVALGDRARETGELLDADGEPVETDVADLIASVVADVEGATRIATDAEPPADGRVGVRIDAPDATVTIDRHTLAAVLGHLVRNAVEHGSEVGDVVAVEATVENGTLRVAIGDEGPGLPANELAALAGDAGDDLQHGTGLGLWLARWGTDRLGGELTVESDDDGTTAIVTVPVSTA